jgi:hypothetical protein
MAAVGSRPWWPPDRQDASMLTTLVTTLAIFALGLAFALLILLAIGTIADKIEAL